LQRAFTDGNSERLREQAKETKAVVDLKKPSLPSFSSVEFVVRLLSLRRNQFTEGSSERLRERAKETEVSVDGRPKPSFSSLSSV